MSFNPFDRPLGAALKIDDLEALKSLRVTEGFFVEFKRELPSELLKVARSIASLANTYGGWYFVGIRTDKHNVADDICGFDPTFCPDPLSKIREILKANVDPVPVIFAQVVVLANGRLVVAVQVPDNQDTPFVTRDGRIYRRANDSSDPIPENNRHALDQLAQRSAKAEKRFERFTEDSRYISRTDSSPWLKVYISPSPFGAIEKFSVVNEESVKLLMEMSHRNRRLFDFDYMASITGSCPFETSFAKLDSVILSQSPKGQEGFHWLSVELDRFGRGRFFLPIRPAYATPEGIEKMQSARALRHVLSRFGIDEEEHPQLHFFNIAQVWLTLVNLSAFYQEWLGPTPNRDGYEIRVEASNIWRLVPYCDHDRWADYVDEHGLPVSLSESSKVPDFSKRGALFTAECSFWVHPCHLVGHAFGLPADVLAAVITDSILQVAKFKDKL